MKTRALFPIALALALCIPALAQDAPPSGQEQGGGRGMMAMGARGVMGTVTNVAPDHYTVKNDTGEIWTIHYSVNTRIVKQAPRPAGVHTHARSQNQGQPQSQPQSQGENPSGQDGGFFRGSGNPPTPIKASEIKPGDAIMAMGDVDQTAKSVGAVMVMQLDPETAKRMEEMRANYGKTWLAGRVTAIQDTTVTLEGPDHASHSFVADENTDFRKRREPITLAEIQVGDPVRVEGAVKDGHFVAATVNVMVSPRAYGGPVRRPGPPPQ
jgi:hypothetical protein